MALDPPRRRPRRGSLERPVSGRIYRVGWTLVAIPLLAAAFSVARPEPLPRPALPLSFDAATALVFANDFARRFPDRSPGSPGASGATDWVVERFGDFGLRAERDAFSARVPGVGRVELVNVAAVAPGRSPQAIVVVAHRDNSGRSPGADDNGSGTGALVELARTVRLASPAHTFVFLSSDGGAYGGLGATHFVERSQYADDVVAVVNLDALAGRGRAGLQFAGDAARSPAASLVATADARIADETDAGAVRPGAVAQLVDLAFPFSFYEQAPFVASGIAAVTLTTGGDRPRAPEGDTLAAVDGARLGELGRAAAALVTSLDESAEAAGGTEAYVYTGSRVVHGWTIQFVLLAALLPFLAAVTDVFARLRRRHVALRPALRSLRSRVAVWLWAGALFAAFAALGLFPGGADRPLSPDSAAATEWPVAALLALGGLAAAGWLVARPRLVPRREVERRETLAGHLVAMLALALVAVLVAATNPYALLFFLPSFHAWLWLPHVADRPLRWRAGLYALGLAGPLVLLASFAFRFELGLDAPWYLAALAAVGYVPSALLAAFLVWGAAAGQLGALACGRYAPYPERWERPARGPIREGIRRVVLLTRRRGSAEQERELRAVD